MKYVNGTMLLINGIDCFFTAAPCIDYIKGGDTLLVLGDEEQGIAIVKADVLKELAVKILKGLGKLSSGIEDEK